VDIASVVLWCVLGLSSSLSIAFYPTKWTADRPFWPENCLLRWLNVAILLAAFAMVVTLSWGVAKFDPNAQGADPNFRTQRFTRRELRLAYYVLGIIPTCAFATHTLAYLERLKKDRIAKLDVVDDLINGLLLPPHFKIWVHFVPVVVVLWTLTYTIFLWSTRIDTEEWAVAVCPAIIVFIYAGAVTSMNQEILEGFTTLFHHRLGHLDDDPAPNFDYVFLARFEPRLVDSNLFTLFGFPLTTVKVVGAAATAVIVPGGVALLQFLFQKRAEAG